MLPVPNNFMNNRFELKSIYFILCTVCCMYRPKALLITGWVAP